MFVLWTLQSVVFFLLTKKSNAFSIKTQKKRISTNNVKSTPNVPKQLRNRKPAGKSSSSENSSKSDSEKSQPPSKMSSLVVVLQAITSLLILACFDLTFTEYFIPHTSLRLAKVGMVNSTHAKIFARFPGTHPIALHYKPDDSSKLMKTVFKTTLKENDYSAQFVLDGLSPDTEYQVTFTINDTAVLNNLSFKTFPKESKAFKFLYSSCVKPNFPYGVRVSAF